MFWKRRRSKRGLKAYVQRSARVLRWTFRAFLLLLILDLVYLGLTWPDWKKIANGPVPKSAFMREYERQRADNKDWPKLRWQPVAFANFPKHLQRAVILAEDSRFYEHSGFDLIAFKEAMDYNLREGRFVFGASTISQQTVKNLFLTPSRNPLRKWHELILTWGMERSLGKRRILEIYLNVVELGRGIYGVQAASQAYWGIGADQLSPQQAAELVATLPSPVKNNPATQTRQFERRSKKLLALLERYPGDAAEAVRERPFELFLPPPENGAETVPEAEHELWPAERPPAQGGDQPPPEAGDEAPPPDSERAYPPVEERSIRSDSL
ncbi:MAG: monofunctional biosynthetic peptidoglycan transglycosylase [Pseudomonadota bacterium]